MNRDTDNAGTPEPEQPGDSSDLSHVEEVHVPIDSLGSQGRQKLRDRRRLSVVAAWSLTLLIGYGIYRGSSLPVEQLFLGIAIIFLAGLPAVRWVQNQPYPFPAFETFMMTGISAYALPLLTEHSVVSMYPDRVVTQSALAVVVFQLGAIFANAAASPHQRTTPFWNEPIFTRDIGSWLPIGLWLNLIYISISRFSPIIPPDIDSVLRSVFFGGSTACSFLLGRKWGSGELTPRQKGSLIVVIVAQTLIMASSLYLITSITTLLVFILAYISAGKKIPVIGLGLVFTVFTVLHNGKAPMREKYWADPAPVVTVWDMPAFFSEWIGHSLTRQLDENNEEVQRRSLLDRASLLHMLCLVVDQTEHLGVPKLGGETYGNVLPQLVPRFFWPGKPSGQVTTRRLSIYFGLQDQTSSWSTSIGFGVLAEAFANFGFMGMLGLGLVIGWSNKVIAVWTRGAPLLSNGGFMMILLMAWSVQVELPMSNWISSFYQTAICVLVLPYALKRFLG